MKHHIIENILKIIIHNINSVQQPNQQAMKFNWRTKNEWVDWMNGWLAGGFGLVMSSRSSALQHSIPLVSLIPFQPHCLSLFFFTAGERSQHQSLLFFLNNWMKDEWRSWLMRESWEWKLITNYSVIWRMNFILQWRRQLSFFTSINHSLIKTKEK